MIKAVFITYQSHVESQLNFDSGVNVIIGDSDQGKSAILRAIKWVVYNRPLGDSFIPNSHDTARVKLVMEDGTSITKVRSGVDNYYHIDGGGKLKSFGTSVPEVIKNTINITNLNFQNQMDAPFLLSSSPGEVSRYLNDIVNLEKIDTSIANVTRRMRETKNLLNARALEAGSLKHELEELNWIPNASDCIRKLEIAKRHMVGATNKSTKIAQVIAQIEDIEEEVDGIHRLSSAKEAVDSLYSTALKMNKINNKASSLNQILSEIKSIKNTLSTTKKERVKMEKELKRIMPETCPLCGK